jgi:hypothetical protein
MVFVTRLRHESTQNIMDRYGIKLNYHHKNCLECKCKIHVKYSGDKARTHSEGQVEILSPHC